MESDESVLGVGEGEGTDVYLHGQCHMLAVALHRITGRPLAVAMAYDMDIEDYALVHCWVRVAGDEVLDASGLTTIAWSLQNYPDGDEVEVFEMDANALLWLGEGHDPDDADVARRMGLAVAVAKELVSRQEVVEALARCH